MDFLYRQVLQYLPPDLQALVLDPPSLSSPSSFLPVIRIIYPYTKWIIILVAALIVWTTVTSLLGYFSRVLRFGFRIGPILALIAWFMTSSGQGSMNDLFEIAKQYVGMGQGNNAGGVSPGIASLAGLLGGDSSAKTQRTTRGRKSTGGLFGSSEDPISSRTRTRKTGTGANTESDVLSSLLKSATNLAEDARDGDWQSVIQDYVKQAVVKASGLEWLLGKSEDDARAGRKGTR